MRNSQSIRQPNTWAYTITISNKANSQKLKLLLFCETGGEAEIWKKRSRRSKKNTGRECCYVLFNKCYMLLIWYVQPVLTSLIRFSEFVFFSWFVVLDRRSACYLFFSSVLSYLSAGTAVEAVASLWAVGILFLFRAPVFRFCVFHTFFLSSLRHICTSYAHCEGKKYLSLRYWLVMGI